MTSDEQTTPPQHEVWRLQYRQRPYLRDSSDDALAQRLKDVMNNFSTLTAEGKIGFLPIVPDGKRWMILFTHILEEYVSRGNKLPTLSEDMPFPQPTAPDLPKSVTALKKIKMPNPGQTLIKFGKRAHMKELYEHGRVRIAPANSYSDPSLNYAVNDDELKFDRVIPRSEVTITFVDQKTGEPKNVKPIGEVTNTISLETNYYIYCLANTLDYRLFDDFNADSCVIIREPAAFSTRLQDTVQTLIPDWIDWNQSVDYIDPYLHTEKNIDLIFSKHFRFWYQQEYRFAWLPKRGVRTHLEPFFVELGSLAQISEIISL